MKEDSISPDVVNRCDSITNTISILSTEPTSNSINWLPHLFINHYDGKLHEDGRWLNDRHINVTQEFLLKQFPLSQSLYNTLLGQLKGWNKMESNGVQIIHENSNH